MPEERDTVRMTTEQQVPRLPVGHKDQPSDMTVVAKLRDDEVLSMGSGGANNKQGNAALAL
jgi:hypothetical protein